MCKEMHVTDNTIIIAYPWNPELLRRMKSNRRHIMMIQERIRFDLKKKGLLQEFDAEVRKQLESGAATLVPDEEIRDWEKTGGAVHYLPMFGVAQPTHAGHKLRVVLNMKMKNQHSGLSPNDCVERPPNALSALLEIIIWWRTSPHCAVSDISRAYQAVRTGLKEKFVRLALWQPQEGEPWQVVG